MVPDNYLPTTSCVQTSCYPFNTRLVNSYFVPFADIYMKCNVFHKRVATPSESPPLNQRTTSAEQLRNAQHTY
jgi:hypothetical protein